MAEGSFEKCEAADAIILGAVGYEVDGKTVFTKPGKPYPEPQLAGFAQVIANRQKLDLYANVRPVKLYPGVKHKIHGELKQVWEPGQSRLRRHSREHRRRLHRRNRMTSRAVK
jgi:3-isopropylmalate dehydrogenase